MIYNLNNLLHLEMHRVLSSNNISSENYPTQDLEKIGKVCQLSINFEDNPNYRIERRYYKDHNIWRHNPNCPWFMIVRYDLIYPFKLIAISNHGIPIVLSTEDFEALYSPPKFVEHNNLDLPLKFKDKQVITEKLLASSEDAFEFLQKREITHNYPAQAEFIGMPVYTEYVPDILSMSRNDVNINDEYFEASDEQIRKELGTINVAFYTYPINVLKGFYQYYNRFIKDKINNPRRAVNMGLVIRNDLGGGTDACIIVLEYRKDGIAFVTNEEANFYYDSLYTYNNIGTQSLLDILNNQKLYNTNFTFKTI